MDSEAAPAATAAKVIAGALLRHAITAGETALSKGYLDQQTGDSATGPIADYVLGAGLPSARLAGARCARS